MIKVILNDPSNEKFLANALDALLELVPGGGVLIYSPEGEDADSEPESEKKGG